MRRSAASAASASSRSSVIAAIMLAAALGVGLAACSTTAPPRDGRPVDATARPAPPGAGLDVATGAVIVRPRARWVPVDWPALPGWRDDRAGEIWPALLASCARPQPAWARLCEEARRDAIGLLGDDAASRAWLEARVVPHRVEASDGVAEGLATGYYEPLLEAARASTADTRGAFRTPVHGPPADLAQKRPYWTRQELATVPAARRALQGREIAYLRDPIDLLVLQIQGSGRLRFADGSVVRVAYAGHNDQPYRSVARWLAERGELRLDAASWPAIRRWAERNPTRVEEMLWSNPRVVFFREEPIADPRVGPRGAEGVALTAGRSVAVDPQSVPYGSLLWIDTTAPASGQPLRRLVVAQDTGSAITGAVRLDYFWGAGDAAEAEAGRMKHPLRWWALVPRDVSAAP